MREDTWRLTVRKVGRLTWHWQLEFHKEGQDFVGLTWTARGAYKQAHKVLEGWKHG